MSECPICGGVDCCKFTKGYLGEEKNLSVEDWREIHHFIRHDFLPLLHRLIHRANKRAEEEKELLRCQIENAKEEEVE